MCLPYFYRSPVVYNEPTKYGSCFLTGETVLSMTAIDYDDPEEGGNADILYSIEKNVVEEDTGLPIFEIDSKTGLITTAVCCLDRERTPDYVIQVVAVDGGGLKGESHLYDVNYFITQQTEEYHVK